MNVKNNGIYLIQSLNHVGKEWLVIVELTQFVHMNCQMHAQPI